MAIAAVTAKIGPGLMRPSSESDELLEERREEREDRLEEQNSP